MRVTYIFGLAFVVVCVHHSYANPLPSEDEAKAQDAKPAADEPPASPAADEPPASSGADELLAYRAADETVTKLAADEPPASPAADEAVKKPAADEPPASPAADEPPASSAADEPQAHRAADEAAADEVSKPAADEVSKPAADEVSKPAADEVSKPAADEVPKPAADEVSQPAADEVSKPAADEAVSPSPGGRRKRHVEPAPHPLRARRDRYPGKSRKHTSEMTTETIKHWKVTLNHVTHTCRKEVAQAFVAAEIAFPGVARPLIYKASGLCNDEIFEAFRKYFDYGKKTLLTNERNTVEMDNPDLTLFVELYGEAGGLGRQIKKDDKGTLSDLDWKESIFKILYKVTSSIPDECREETGLVFDVAIGESLDIGFVDRKKNFKITEKCSKHSYDALEGFFRKLRELGEATEVKEDLVEESKLWKSVYEWRHNKFEQKKHIAPYPGLDKAIVRPQPRPHPFPELPRPLPLPSKVKLDEFKDSPKILDLTENEPVDQPDKDSKVSPDLPLIGLKKFEELSTVPPAQPRKIEEPSNLSPIQLKKVEEPGGEEFEN